MSAADDKWLAAEDARLRYRIEGNGPPILLIHEMGGAIESWDGVVAALGGSRTTLRHDQRGCGRSSPIAGTVDLDQLVVDALAIWDASGLPTPALIVASALGCAVAVRLAAQNPDRVSGLLLLTPALGVPEERRPGVLAVADRIEQEGAEAFVGSTLDLAYPVQFRDPPERFAGFRAVQFANDAASLGAWWRMLARIDLTTDVEALAVSATILAGSADQIRPPTQVPRLPGAAFTVVESGHFMAVQTPEIVADEIRRAANPTS